MSNSEFIKEFKKSGEFIVEYEGMEYWKRGTSVIGISCTQKCYNPMFYVSENCNIEDLKKMLLPGWVD